MAVSLAPSPGTYCTMARSCKASAMRQPCVSPMPTKQSSNTTTHGRSAPTATVWRSALPWRRLDSAGKDGLELTEPTAHPWLPDHTIQHVGVLSDRANLAALTAANWIILHRPPALLPSNFMAFRPMRVPGNVIQIHPLTTDWMNADFDGDQAALFLPVTEAGQQEAGEKLTMASHFARSLPSETGLHTH